MRPGRAVITLTIPCCLPQNQVIIFDDQKKLRYLVRYPIESYLTKRQQRVRVNGHFSGVTKVTSGVPQGSTVSTFLFLVYINDFTSLCKSSLPLLCADDAKFIAMNKQKLHFQLDLSRVERWSNEHQLPLNVNKCSHLAFHNNVVEFYFSGGWL